MGVHALCYLAFDTIESTTANEEDIPCIYVYVVLIGMLAATLRRNVHHSSFEQFQQSLLHALATHVARNARIVALACYLVNLVNEHDATLGSLKVVVGHLQQTRENALHVLAHIAGLGEYRSIDYRERHFEQLGYRAGNKRFARTCRAYHDNIALLYLHTGVVLRLLQSFIVVIHRH